MAEMPIKDTRGTSLPRQAGTKLRKRDGVYPDHEQEDFDAMLYELQANLAGHAVQNDELLTIRRVLATAEKKYTGLYSKFVSLFDHVPNGYLVMDPDGSIREGNLTAAISLNIPKAKLVDRCITDFIHRDDQDIFHVNRQGCRDNSLGSIFEIEMVRKDWSTFTAQVQLQCYREEESGHQEIRMSFLDISGKTALSSSLSLLQNCMETAGRANSRRQLLTEFVEHIKAFTGADAVGIRLRELGQGSFSAHYEGFGKVFCQSECLFDIVSGRCICATAIKGNVESHPSYFAQQGVFFVNAASRRPAQQALEDRGGLCQDCCLRGYESLALIPVLGKGTVLGLIYVADKRENKVPLRVASALEKAAIRLSMALQRIDALDRLATSVTDLEDLSLRLLSAQEEEQKRIAAELHDQTGQELCLFKLRLKEILDRVKRRDPDLQSDGEQLMALTDSIIENIRQIIHGLNPVPLVRAGLGPALEQMVAELLKATPLRIKLSLKHLDTIKSRDVQIGLYRILQEALTNIAKHARASRASISTTRRGNDLFIEVEDDGRGIDLRPKGTGSCQNSGLGLQSMALRARLIGADLTLCKQTKKGTLVTLRLPLA